MVDSENIKDIFLKDVRLNQTFVAGKIIGEPEDTNPATGFPFGEYELPQINSDRFASDLAKLKGIAIDTHTNISSNISFNDASCGKVYTDQLFISAGNIEDSILSGVTGSFNTIENVLLSNVDSLEEVQNLSNATIRCTRLRSQVDILGFGARSAIQIRDSRVSLTTPALTGSGIVVEDSTLEGDSEIASFVEIKSARIRNSNIGSGARIMSEDSSSDSDILGNSFEFSPNEIDDTTISGDARITNSSVSLSSFDGSVELTESKIINGGTFSGDATLIGSTFTFAGTNSTVGDSIELIDSDVVINAGFNSVAIGSNLNLLQSILNVGAGGIGDDAPIGIVQSRSGAQLGIRFLFQTTLLLPTS